MIVRFLAGFTCCPDYWTATVGAPAADELAAPTLITMGMLPPTGAWRISRLTCMTPVTMPGAEPAYCTSAVTPPMVAVTVATGFLRPEPSDGMMAPSVPWGLRHAFAGHIDGNDVAALFGNDGLLIAPFWFRIAPGPVP